MQPIPKEMAEWMCQKLDYDQIIIYGRKEGMEGGECMSYAGSSRRNWHVADEMARFLKQKVFGWAPEPDDPHAGELPTAAPGSSEDLGNKIMHNVLEKKRIIQP